MSQEDLFGLASEFEFDGQSYRLSKLNTMVQHHVVRRISPILAELLPALQKAGTKKDAQDEAEMAAALADIGSPVMEGLSKLSDKDYEYVLLKLLSGVEIQQKDFKLWNKVANDSGIIYPDIVDFATSLMLAGRALSYNLTGFFSLLTRSGSKTTSLPNAP